MSTSLSIKGKTQGNEAVTSTINYVNPNATTANLVSLATAMNNLTVNTISDITRIDKNSLINTVEKLPRNAYLTTAQSETPITSLKSSEISTDPNIPTMLQIRYADKAGDYEDVSITLNANTSTGYYYYMWNGEGPSPREDPILCVLKGSSGTYADTITITIAEDSEYQAATLTLTITAD